MEIIDPLSAIFPLEYRIAIGLTVFCILAIYDLAKFGRESRRIREYGFVVAVMMLTVIYAALHDLVTSSISPEYFTAGKGLPNDHLHLRAAWLGSLAALGPGALLGVMLTFANNPTPMLCQLPYTRLFQYLAFPIAAAILFAAVFGLMGFIDVRKIGPDLAGSIQQPVRFIIVWGIHWGTYVGGSVGLCISLILIRRERRRASSRLSSRK